MDEKLSKKRLNNRKGDQKMGGEKLIWRKAVEKINGLERNFQKL